MCLGTAKLKAVPVQERVLQHAIESNSNDAFIAWCN